METPTNRLTLLNGLPPEEVCAGPRHIEQTINLSALQCEEPVVHDPVSPPSLEMPARQASESEQWAIANQQMALALVVLLPIALGRQILVPDPEAWGPAAIAGVFVVWTICLLEYLSSRKWIAVSIPRLLLPALGSTGVLIAMAFASPTVFMWIIPAMFINFMRAPWRLAMAAGFCTLLVAQVLALAVLQVNMALFVRISLSGAFSLILFTLFFRTASNTKIQLDRARTHLTTINESLEAANIELNKQQDQLLELVKERTRNLITARNEAESANAIKTQLMANVNHEMRHPLQNILGYAEVGKLRLEEAPLEEIDAHLERILAAGNQMHRLVENLLTLADKSWDQHNDLNQSNIQEIDVAHFFHSMSKVLALRAEISGHHLSTVSGAISCAMVGDPKQLQQIFEHLFSNALLYSAKGSTVTWKVSEKVIATAANSNTRGAINFEILDEGCGIPENELKAVFEPFYESTRTASGGGSTGLGLPLSQAIAVRHGGHITLSNRTEGGLSCQVSLPTVAMQTATNS
jgi:signal transduction histidine kinase